MHPTDFIPGLPMISPGDILGNFKIVRPLGSGGMADVYEAEDISLGRHVALKILPLEFGRNTDLVSRFEREIRAAASLNHRGIVTVFEVGRDHSLHFYSMRLLRGGDLRARITAGLSPAETFAILREITEAFQHAHSRGFVHRDVKPGNIMFDEQGYPVLTDFGIVKALESNTQYTKTGASIGTPRYMAPEQARGNPLDARADLYSLGVVLFEMLTGRPPYEAENGFALMLKHISDPIPRLPEELAQFQGLIELMMAKDPDGRPSSAEELLELIDEILLTEPSFASSVARARKNPMVANLLTPRPGRPTTVEALRARSAIRTVDSPAINRDRTVVTEDHESDASIQAWKRITEDRSRFGLDPGIASQARAEAQQRAEREAQERFAAEREAATRAAEKAEAEKAATEKRRADEVRAKADEARRREAEVKAARNLKAEQARIQAEERSRQREEQARQRALKAEHEALEKQQLQANRLAEKQQQAEAKRRKQAADAQAKEKRKAEERQNRAEKQRLATERAPSAATPPRRQGRAPRIFVGVGFIAALSLTLWLYQADERHEKAVPIAQSSSPATGDDIEASARPASAPAAKISYFPATTSLVISPSTGESFNSVMATPVERELPPTPPTKRINRSLPVQDSVALREQARRRQEEEAAALSRRRAIELEAEQTATRQQEEATRQRRETREAALALQAQAQAAEAAAAQKAFQEAAALKQAELDEAARKESKKVERANSPVGF